MENGDNLSQKKIEDPAGEHQVRPSVTSGYVAKSPEREALAIVLYVQ